MERIPESIIQEIYDETTELLNSIPTISNNEMEQMFLKVKSVQSNELCLQRYFKAEVSILDIFHIDTRLSYVEFL